MFGGFYFGESYFGEIAINDVPAEQGSWNGDNDFNTHKKAKDRIKKQNELIINLLKAYYDQHHI